ncbi:F-box domain-containing protein [Rhodotorula toruloides]|uniref:F-box domain-containing protein n=1 Tax=Rhodotorula toruloides TaxID=5286 RepID=A0A511KCA5_RHOTO|nr:F-box domain-containing protein [Rhodotorula toruloides]
MSSPPQPGSSGLEDELAAFRAQWQAETRRRQALQRDEPAPASSSASRHHRVEAPTQAPPAAVPTSPKRPRRSLGSEDGELVKQVAELQVEEREASPRAKGKAKEVREQPREKERERPKSALELYETAVVSEREGRMHDALVNYRSAFRLDPDVDRAYHLASVAAAQKHAASRGAQPTHASGSNPQEWRFERTVQLGPDYDAKKEHRSKEEAQRESGSADADSTHPSSTGFLLNSLLKSIAENPYERPHPPIHAASPAARDGPASPRSAAESLPATSAQSDKPKPPPMTPEEALASLHFIPADEDQPLPLAHLPREVLLLVLRHVVLSGMNPPRSLPPYPDSDTPPAAPSTRSKRFPRKRTLREELHALELELDLEHIDREWHSDVEALERFARTCRAARVVTLDSGIWRALCLRTYVPPQQISPEEEAMQLIKQHGNDWRRFYIEHPRCRLDGVYISVVTYLRRGETVSVYAPTHLITFYRYLRFYHHGLAISLLTTDPPGQVVRRLNPTLRMSGLSFGRWRLRGDLVEVWGLEDPSVPEERRKYSLRMNCRFKSTARGRMNKLEMLSLATENRRTLELEDVPIRPSKPFFFSKVQSYALEDRVEGSSSVV